jgi:hypothetical protein
VADQTTGTASRQHPLRPRNRWQGQVGIETAPPGENDTAGWTTDTTITHAVASAAGAEVWGRDPGTLRVDAAGAEVWLIGGGGGGGGHSWMLAG